MSNHKIYQTVEGVQQSWLSGHLYSHESLNRVVQRFVHPLIVSLAKDGEIDGFFFVRYGLGGPHIRLRLHPTPAALDHALEAMQQSANRFLELEPSTRSVDEEVIRRTNQALLAGDSTEFDESIYPDNSFRMAPFRPEIDRYGGLDRLRISLDFFTLSSVAAVEFVLRHGDASRSTQLAQAFRLLLLQACGFAADRTELLDLLRYGVDSWGQFYQKVVEKGDRVARSQKEVFLELFHDALAEVGSPRATSGSLSTASDFLVAGASRLSSALGDADRDTRARIGGSQLHMTASRIGLSNAEEVYISRLLTVTLGEALAVGGQRFLWLEPEGASEGQKNALLQDLLLPALKSLAANAESEAPEA